MNRKKILFVYSNYSSFVESDYRILSDNFEVQKYQYKAIKGLAGTGKETLRQLFFLIANFSKFDAVYIWFADYHSLLPVLFARLFHKKSFIVVGGYDVSYLPEYNYGSFNKPIRKYFTRTSLKLSTICFPVAEALGIKIKEISQGSKIEVLPTSTDSELFKNSVSERPKTVTHHCLNRHLPACHDQRP